jgi:trans-aconitate methyltransferase
MPSPDPSLLPLEAGRRAFGGDPAQYHRARLDYPDAVYDWLAETSDLAAARIFEIGPGTGLATRRLLERHPLSLTAIEPDDRLADHLQATLGAGSPCLSITRCPFEDAPLPPAAFDLGVAATSFHWLEQVAALRKVFGLLRPGGWWTMWWNVFGDPGQPDDFQKATGALFSRLPHSPSWRDDGKPPFTLDREARLAQMRASGLVDAECRIVPWTTVLDTRQMRELAATFSQVTQAEPEPRKRFLAELEAVIEGTFGGRVERRFLTAFYRGRKPAPPVTP